MWLPFVDRVTGVVSAPRGSAIADLPMTELDLEVQKLVWHTDCLRFNVWGHGFSWQQIPPSNVSEIPLHFDAVVPRQWQCSFTAYLVGL